MEISAKRMRGLFSASILISSENDIPSDSSRISSKIERRKTHIPDCESRTHWKYNSDIANDKTQFPNLCLKLIARRSRTGKRDAFRKSTSRCKKASIKYEIASGG